MFGRVDALLVAGDGSSAEQLVEAVAREAAVMRAEAGAGVGVRVSRRYVNPDATPVAAAQTNAALSRYDAVLSIGAEDTNAAALVPLLDGLGARLGPAVDLSRCSAIAGWVEVIIAGNGPRYSLYPLRRVASLSVEQFHEYWLQTHASFARKIPGLTGYRQFHGEPEITAQAVTTLGAGVGDYEGIAEGRRELGAASKVEPGPWLDDVLADERNFIDVDRCGPTVYEAVSGAETFGG